MPIERVTTSYYRLPIEPSDDAGHGLLDHEELIVVEAAADGLVGQGYASTIGRGSRLARYRPRWLEEPSPPEDVEGHARLVGALPMPIAVGESLHSVAEFERYIRAGAVGVAQIDPNTNGGITPALEILKLADAAGLPTSSHDTDELSAHLLCASANPIYLEKHAFALDAYLESPQVVTDGSVRPTDEPGTGLRFDRRALARFAG